MNQLADSRSTRVAVVSDTTAYLPAEFVREHDIRLVSLYVNWDDGSERESEMAGFDSFYDRLRTSEQLPDHLPALGECDLLLLLGTDFPYREFLPANATIVRSTTTPPTSVDAPTSVSVWSGTSATRCGVCCRG